ncbi:MAG: DinB family protein [Armatimonadota bacterium]|nr:DinB family protein [Armatimonadota bacterium]
MTAQELLRFQLDDLGFQLQACLEPMTEAQLDTRPAQQGGTPRETVEHLCEAYMAFLAGVDGEKWSWGTFSIEDKSKGNLLATFSEIRGRAVAAVCASDDEKCLKEAHAYIVAHDAYHVGQLCLVLMTTDPDWDAYSIYNH